MDIGGLCILPYWAVSLGILGVLDDRVLGGLAREFGLGGCCADLADLSRHLLGTWGAISSRPTPAALLPGCK